MAISAVARPRMLGEDADRLMIPPEATLDGLVRRVVLRGVGIRGIGAGDEGGGLMCF